MTLDNNRVRELLVKMTHHRQTCLPLVNPQSHMTLARAAYRFVKIEKVMIKRWRSCSSIKTVNNSLQKMPPNTALPS